MRRVLAALLALASIAPAIGCGNPFSSKRELPTVKVERKDFDVKLDIPGEIEAVNSSTIAVPQLGRDVKITSIVEDGTRVSKGDLLAEFDRTDLETRLEAEHSQLEISQTKIIQNRAQLELKLKDLEDQVSKAQLDLERSHLHVTESEAVPRVDRQSAVLDVTQSEINLERSKKALQQARLEGEAGLELLRIEVRQAQARVDDAQRRLDKATIYSPTDGLVIKNEIWRSGAMGTVKAGDVVWSGNPILSLPDMALMQVVAWVHEVDAERVAPDQKVKIYLDSHPDPPFSGTVEKLASLAIKREDANPAKYLKVTVKLDVTDPLMKPGMTVRAELLIDRVPNVLTLPREAVFYEESSADAQAGVAPEGYAWRKGSFSRWERVPVLTGRTNDTHLVVTSGLDEGDEVALVDPDRWSKGQDEPAATPDSRPHESPAAPAAP
jgi:HlyD family secretion protein